MEKINVDKFRNALSKHREALFEWINTDSHHKDINLGGENPEEVFKIISELKDALERIDSGEFGRCKECGEEVEADRLGLDCTTQVCLGHYSEDQIKAIEYDLELAAKVQRQLLPCCVPTLPGVQISAHIEHAL